jgi:hypothetical protein
VRVLVVEAPGVLYPGESFPPNADPITSGLRLTRAMSEGFGISVLVVGQLPTVDHEKQLKAWLRTYDVTFNWTVTSDRHTTVQEFWERKVMTFLGSLRAAPPAVVSASPWVCNMLASKSVPTLQFRPPDGIAPNWGPMASSWENPTFVEE